MMNDEELRRAVNRLSPERAERLAEDISRGMALDGALVRRMILMAQALTAVPPEALPDGDDLASRIVGSFSRCPILEPVPEGARWAVVQSLFRRVAAPAEP